jgi:hypothetical protein
MAANLAALKALAARQSGRDPYVTRRTAEITSGMDDMVPEADSYDAHSAQADAFESSGGTWAPSRDALRTSAFGKLKTLLGQQQIKHQQGLEEKELEGRYDIEKERVGNEASMDRFYAQQEALDRRQGRSLEATDARTQMQIDAALAKQRDAQAFKQANPTASNAVVPGGMYEGIAKAQKEYAESRGPMGKLKRMLGGADSQAEAYRQQLANYLDRKGDLQETEMVAAQLAKMPGATFEEKVAAARNDPAFEHDIDAFDANTQTYLKLKLGQ